MNNGLQPTVPRSWSESAPIAIPTSGAVEFVHGRGHVPVAQVTMLCLVAEAGYNPGDEVPVGGEQRNTAAPAQPFLGYTVTSTKVIVSRNTGNADIWKKDGSGFQSPLTPANWAIKIRCL